MPTDNDILKALRACASLGSCDDCYREKTDDCMFLLMADAAEAIEELMGDNE